MASSSSSSSSPAAPDVSETININRKFLESCSLVQPHEADVPASSSSTSSTSWQSLFLRECQSAGPGVSKPPSRCVCCCCCCCCCFCFCCYFSCLESGMPTTLDMSLFLYFSSFRLPARLETHPFSSLTFALSFSLICSAMLSSLFAQCMRQMRLVWENFRWLPTCLVQL